MMNSFLPRIRSFTTRTKPREEIGLQVRGYLLFLGLSFFLGAGLFAPLALDAQTLTLEKARTMALSNSRSLAKLNMSIRGSLIDERNQLFSMLPSPSASYSASVDYLEKDSGFVNPADTFNSSLTLSVTQKIFEGGKSFIQREIGKIATESVRKDMLSEYFNVLDSADNAYYAVLEAAATLEAGESSLQAAVLSLAVAEIRQANGMINQGDYLKALADKETRENSRNQTRRTLALNMNKLKTIIGVSENIELEQINFDAYEGLILFLAGISDEDAQSLYERFWGIIVKDNPSFAKAALGKQRAEMNHTLTKRDLAPVISATIFSTGFNYSAARGYSNSLTGGVTLRGTIPIDFWVFSNKLKKSEIALESSNLDYLGAEISMETELQSSLLSVFAQAGSALSSRRSVEYAEKHFEFVMERYRLSQSSVSDVGEATTLLITNQNNLIKARYGFLQSLSKLRSLSAIDEEARLLEILQGK